MILAVSPALLLYFDGPGTAATKSIPITRTAAASSSLPSGASSAVQTASPPSPAGLREAPKVDPPIVVPATDAAQAKPPRHAKGDPFEHFNRSMFNRQEKFDKAVFRPVALAYEHFVPKPVRSGLRNFLRNLTEPIVFLNYVLQFKLGRAAETVGRFVLNSTLGLGGVLDIATLPGVKLPHRSNGFGDTLGYYGVKPGPYLFLPFVGPTDVRDLLGGQADGLILPIAVGHPFDQLKYQVPKAVVGGLDQRAEADGDLNALFGGAVDPYATLRSVYLQDRAGEIMALKGRPAVSATHDELTDPLADPAGPPVDQFTPPELDDPLADPAASPPVSAAPELGDPLADPATTP